MIKMDSTQVSQIILASLYADANVVDFVSWTGAHWGI